MDFLLPILPLAFPFIMFLIFFGILKKASRKVNRNHKQKYRSKRNHNLHTNNPGSDTFNAYSVYDSDYNDENYDDGRGGDSGGGGSSRSFYYDDDYGNDYDDDSDDGDSGDSDSDSGDSSSD